MSIELTAEEKVSATLSQAVNLANTIEKAPVQIENIQKNINAAKDRAKEQLSKLLEDESLCKALGDDRLNAINALIA